MLWIVLRIIIGWLWWYIFPIRKALAIRNYQSCFPERPVTDLQKSVGDSVVQYLYLAMGWRASVHLPEGIEKGGIVLAGHSSAWDIALLSLADQVPVTIFLRRPSNRILAKFIAHHRNRSNIEGLFGRNCMARAYEALGEGRLVVFVQDQRHNDGITTSFFGRPCQTSAAFASMLYRQKGPVFGMWQHNEGSRIHVDVRPLRLEIPNDRQQAITVLTQQSQNFYADKISEKPHSWLWLHDRWKVVS